MLELSFLKVSIFISILILIEGFFSGSEIALISADELKLKDRSSNGSKGSKIALELIKNPEKILSTTLLMTSLSVVGITTIIALYLLQIKSGHPELYSILIASPIIVIFGELIPKTIFQKASDSIAPQVSYLILIFYWIFYPITRLLSTYTYRLSKFISPIELFLSGNSRNTRDELRTILKLNRSETEIKPNEKKMIKRIFEFQESEAKNALIPLFNVDAIESNSSMKEALESFQEHRHSRMPVYSERIDNIIGIIDVNQLFAVKKLETPIHSFMKSAHYVANTQSLEDVLIEMNQKNSDMAIVVDEHGGAIGIITYEDIVEEIVGEIEDEFDEEENLIRKLSPHLWKINAIAEIQEVNEIIGIEIPEGDYETMNGFLLEQFGEIPKINDEIQLKLPSGLYLIRIMAANERKVESIRIEIIKKFPSEE